MNLTKWTKTLLTISAGVMAIQAHAGTIDFGTDVTIFDDNNVRNNDYYWNRQWHGSTSEDQEVEPGMIANQSWDLEGTFISDSSLTLVGGYDFLNGNGDFDSGDIFLSVGDAPDYGDKHIRGDSNSLTKKQYGYEYVLDLDIANGSYNIVLLNEDTWLYEAFYGVNEGSSPWQFDSTYETTSKKWEWNGKRWVKKTVTTTHDNAGTVIGSGSLTYTSGLTDEQTGFEGGTHYSIALDLASIYAAIGWDNTFYSHFTMGCGNDNLMGSWEGVDVPEPGTLALLSMGLFGLWSSRRRLRN